MDARTVGFILLACVVVLVLRYWDVLCGVYLEFRRAHREAAVQAELDAVARESLLQARGEDDRARVRQKVAALYLVSRRKRGVGCDDAA
jgi:hypothetical protein